VPYDSIVDSIPRTPRTAEGNATYVDWEPRKEILWTKDSEASATADAVSSSIIHAS